MASHVALHSVQDFLLLVSYVRRAALFTGRKQYSVAAFAAPIGADAQPVGHVPAAAGAPPPPAPPAPAPPPAPPAGAVTVSTMRVTAAVLASRRPFTDAPSVEEIEA
jgi:hypothetical protein